MKNTREILESYNIEDSYFESRALLCHVLQIRPETLYSNLEYIINDDEWLRLASLINRRIGNEPLAYLVGTKEFYGIDLSVNNNVLIPRPETEMLVEESLNIIEQKQTLFTTEHVLIADVGTGSGAISVALASKKTGIKIYALDISEKALEVTRQNINKYQLFDVIIPVKSDLLGGLPDPVDLIVANLPYIKQTDIYILAPEIRDFEPSVALDGGDDGTEIICRLLINAGSYLKVGGYILLEIGQGQVSKITDFIHSHVGNANYLILDDYNGISRILKIWFQSSV